MRLTAPHYRSGAARLRDPRYEAFCHIVASGHTPLVAALGAGLMTGEGHLRAYMKNKALRERIEMLRSATYRATNPYRPKQLAPATPDAADFEAMDEEDDTDA